MDIKSTQSKKQIIKKVTKVINYIGLGLVISIGMATVAAAQTGSYVGDGFGKVVRDGYGNCVRADSGVSFTECGPKVVTAEPIRKPVAPVVIKPKPPVMVKPKPVVKPKPMVKAPPPAPRMMTKVLSLNEASGANFGFDKDNLTSNAQQTLSSFAATVRNSNITPSSVSVIGHTDSTGPKAYNQKLSERRANSVANYLSNQGMNRNTMQVSGRGETQPVSSNATKAGRAENRRVDIRVTGQRTITVKQ